MRIGTIGESTSYINRRNVKNNPPLNSLKSQKKVDTSPKSRHFQNTGNVTCKKLLLHFSFKVADYI